MIIIHLEPCRDIVFEFKACRDQRINNKHVAKGKISISAAHYYYPVEIKRSLTCCQELAPYRYQSWPALGFYSSRIDAEPGNYWKFLKQKS